ncbi:MBL fold metallo-hydrolase [Undibacterium sp.]|jgi:glyoxylase-like metal-dependent hydrolase (beta-lactamase superfamily II)|uniref:MBL fold metallo-hydrolase n=1 Tax=Undibacterium sp. TaxID=1914977 RepID=UPI002CA8C886|nr:MBL fold metallo-hydrolase [Undibacterium sp.]HTD04052.1 MBL fold metallo-hydrolase [Undibacterium sp.]
MSIRALRACLLGSLFFLFLLPRTFAQADDQPRPKIANAPAATLEFAIVKTSEVTTLEGLSYAGGSYFRSARLQHIAVLVRHPQGNFLFDSGLGKNIDAQFKDMPVWARPFFSYGPVTPARTQLDAAGYSDIPRIFLSHAHWDHASALVDFPEAEVWLSQQEKIYLETPHAASVFPSQIGAPSIRWHTYALQPKPTMGFALSLDIFGDGSAVLLPLPGHTPGSVGLLLTLASGKQYFFIGDTVWKNQAIAEQKPKMWLASALVDNDKAQTMAAIAAIRRLQQAQPQIVIVPAHDAAIHDGIGYFPHFVK